MVAGLRVRGTPPLPWLSRLPELNVRAYVDYGGHPGIYFFRLDAARLAAVAAARWAHPAAVLPRGDECPSPGRNGALREQAGRLERAFRPSSGRATALRAPASETEGASEIEIEFRGDDPFGTVVGTSRADEFHWNLGGAGPALNLNPDTAGDQDVDVAILEGGILGGFLVADGAAGNDRIIPAPGAQFRADEVWSDGGRGDDFLMAPPRTAGQLNGGMGNDVLAGGRFEDELVGGAGNDRVAGAGGGDVIRGGRGRDLLLGGPGHDGINSRDSRRDSVRCGAGRDLVKADRQDRLRGCEIIRRR